MPEVVIQKVALSGKVERVTGIIFVAGPVPATGTKLVSDTLSYILYRADLEPQRPTYLTEEEHPLLAELWDNEDDDIYDQV